METNVESYEFSGLQESSLGGRGRSGVRRRAYGRFPGEMVREREGEELLNNISFVKGLYVKCAFLLMQFPGTHPSEIKMTKKNQIWIAVNDRDPNPGSIKEVRSNMGGPYAFSPVLAGAFLQNSPSSGHVLQPFPPNRHRLHFRRENRDFAIIKSGLRPFAIPQMGFAHLPLSNCAHTMERRFGAKFILFLFWQDVFLPLLH